MSTVTEFSSESSWEIKPSHPVFRLPLDDGLYNLKDTEKEFFKELTGIQDNDELKQHIVSVQEKAYEVYKYPCIRRFAFTSLKISRLHAYHALLKLRAERPDAILLDIGCCFGNDIRKAVHDGWPVENVIASDLRPEFWDYGHELFKSTPSTFPAVFVGGDAFDSDFISPRSVFTSSSPPTTSRPTSLKDLTSLTPLQGHISSIHASSFFHLFDEAKQLDLAERLGSLLSPQPNSMIFGAHVAHPEKGHQQSQQDKDHPGVFCHSPESWIGMWDGGVFEKGMVDVKAHLLDIERPDFSQFAPAGTKYYLLSWSVTRL